MSIIRRRLIVRFSSAFGTWKDDVVKFFPQMVVRYYVGSLGKGTIFERSSVLPVSAKDFNNWAESLDNHDPSTTEIIALITWPNTSRTKLT